MLMMSDAPGRRNLRRSLILLPMLLIVSAAVACSGLGDQPTSTMTIPTVTETAEATRTPTPTPTPIPAPQGVWSQYSNGNDLFDLEMDGEGFLWGIGLGGVIRWDPGASEYQQYSKRDGLPSNIAQDIFIGPEGKVWLNFPGHGLWRFDDPEWTSFVEQGVAEGTRVDAFAVVPGKELWICTDEGLSKYDGYEWTAYPVTGGFAEGNCDYLAVDNQGGAWILGNSGFSVFYEPADWIPYDTSAYGQISLYFRNPIGAHAALDGTVWLVTEQNIFWWNGNEMQNANIRPNAFALASNGQPWVLSHGDPSENIVTYAYGNYPQIDFDGDDDPVWVWGYYWPLPFHDRMPTERMYDIFPGRSGEMWITCDRGLLRIRGESISLIQIEGISSGRGIRDVEITNSGEIYLALPDGISRLYGEQLIPLHTEMRLSGNSIDNLAVGLDGTLWVETERGLQTFDGETWTTISPPSRTIYDIQIASNGDVWLSHGARGVSRWDGISWEQFESGSEPGYLDGVVGSLDVGADGVLWLGMGDVGVSSYDGSQWTEYPFDEGMRGSRDLVVDGNGDIFLIGRNSEFDYIYLHRLSGGIWTTQEMQEQGLVLTVGPDGSVWIGQGAGGVSSVFNIREGDWSSIDLVSDVPVGWIYDIQFGADGSMWLGTSTGAWRYDGLEWHNYTQADGLRGDYVDTIAIGKDNTIWFGGIGLTRFGPP